VGLLFNKTTGNILAVNIFSILFVCFCVSLLSVIFSFCTNLTVKETVHQKKKKTLLLTYNAEFELLRALQDCIKKKSSAFPAIVAPLLGMYPLKP